MKIAAGLLPIATLFAASAIATVIFANDTLAGANVQMAPDGGIRLTVGALGPAAVNADSGEKESLSDAERLVLERDEEFQTRLRDALRGSDRGGPLVSPLPSPTPTRTREPRATSTGRATPTRPASDAGADPDPRTD